MNICITFLYQRYTYILLKAATIRMYSIFLLYPTLNVCYVRRMLQNYAYLLFIKYLSKCSPKFRSKYINGISNVGIYSDLFTYSAFPRETKMDCQIAFTPLCTDSRSFSLSRELSTFRCHECILFLNRYRPRIYYGNGKQASVVLSLGVQLDIIDIL